MPTSTMADPGSKKTRMKFLGRHIMLRGIYTDKLLRGEKRATIRRGLVKPKYSELIVHAGGKPVAKVKITRVYYKKLKELGDYEAKMEGYDRAEDLIRELKRVYGGLKDDDYVTVIEFEVVQRLNQLEPEDPYLGLKPADIARIALRYLQNELSLFEREVLLDLTRTNSIRRTALRILKNLNKRYIVRGILRETLKLLISKNLININEASKDT